MNRNRSFRHKSAGMTALLALALLGGCAGTKLPHGETAYRLYPAAPADGASEVPAEYRLGPLDVISVTVFDEPTLSVANAQVDAGGNVLLPLVGSVHAAGRTSVELASDVAGLLGARYLENPQVAVNVTTAASQKVTVDGAVTEPGIYKLEGRTTLLGALAMAKGTTRVSSLGQVVLFRTVDKEPMAAVFDVGKIRRGQMPDPEIQGDDIVVVGFSNVKGVWRDLLTTAPFVAAFRAYR